MDAAEKQTLTLPALFDSLEHVRRFIEQAGQALEGDEDAVQDLVIAANEIATNIVMYAYGEAGGSFEVAVWKEDADLVVSIADDGQPFDPTGAAAPDTSVPLHMRTPGGNGIHVARHFVDSMRYRVPAGGGNEVTLVRAAFA